MLYKNTLDGIGIRITYCHIPTEEVRYFHEFISFNELQNWYDTLLASYAKMGFLADQMAGRT